jgi:hypothetical protein
MALPEWFHELAKRVSNRGRWGADDEIGTLNLITPEATLRGTRCVRTGKSFSLALPMSQDGPQTGRIPGRVNPLHTMTGINTPFTGDPGELLPLRRRHADGPPGRDALGRARARELRRADLQRLSRRDGDGRARRDALRIEKVRPIVTRGVLLDVARTKGVARLDAGYPISAADLDEALGRARLALLPGDVVLVRTGQMEHLRAGDREAYRIPSPGLADQHRGMVSQPRRRRSRHRHDALRGLARRARRRAPPVHLLDLVDMGMTQGQNWVLDALADDLRADGVHEFLLSATPEPVVGAVGSPVHPVAVK